MTLWASGEQGEAALPDASLAVCASCLCTQQIWCPGVHWMQGGVDLFSRGSRSANLNPSPACICSGSPRASKMDAYPQAIPVWASLSPPAVECGVRTPDGGQDLEGRPLQTSR